MGTPGLQISIDVGQRRHSHTDRVTRTHNNHQLSSDFQSAPLWGLNTENIQCTLMAIADIIQEIDAYIARLSQARDLLRASLTGALHPRESYRTRKVAVGKTAPALPGKERVGDVKSRLNSAERKIKPARGANASASEQRRPEPPQAVEAHQPLIAPTAPVPVETPAPAQTLERAEPGTERAEPGTPRRRARRRVVREISKAIAETRKPVNALSNSTASRVIVVSAAEVQRERERAAQSVAVRPRVSWTGQTGRLAFEALFKNEPDTSPANGGTETVGGMNDSFK
jgi:hypothetical protein